MKKAKLFLSMLMVLASFAACGSPSDNVSDNGGASETDVNATETETSAEMSLTEQSYFDWASKTIADSSY